MHFYNRQQKSLQFAWGGILFAFLLPLQVVQAQTVPTTVAEEVIAREGADTALGERIDGLTADGGAIATERVDRAAEISIERAARMAAIATERLDRAAAIVTERDARETAIETAIDTESGARGGEVDRLDGRIDGVNTRLGALESVTDGLSEARARDIDTKVAAEAAERKRLDDLQDVKIKDNTDLSGDNKIGLAAEVENRELDVRDLGIRIDAIATQRATDINAAVGSVRTDLTDEIQTRGSADGIHTANIETNRQAIGDEIDDREAAIETLRKRFDGDGTAIGEIAERKVEDGLLGGRIDDVDERVTMEMGARVADVDTVRKLILGDGTLNPDGTPSTGEIAERKAADTDIRMTVTTKETESMARDTAISETAKTLRMEFDAEVKEREADEGQIRTAISTNSSNISQANTDIETLRDDLHGNTDGKVGEIQNRINEDTILRDRIRMEEEARDAGDTKVLADVAVLVEAAKDADDLLEGVQNDGIKKNLDDIAVETGQRMLEDGMIREDIMDEEDERIRQDNLLGSRIDTERMSSIMRDDDLGDLIVEESTARTNADNALGIRVDDETTARTVADKAINTRITELEADLSAGIALSLALQAPTISHGKKLNLSIGAGTYNSETALAFSFGARVNRRWQVNGGIGYGSSRSEFGARIGATIEY